MNPKSITPGRTCGACRACCIAPEIPELKKPAHVPCRHLCKAGCSIYTAPERPLLCGTFRCMWLDGAFPESYRPDRLGTIFEYREDAGVRHVVARELWRGALDDSRSWKIWSRVVGRVDLVRKDPDQA